MNQVIPGVYALLLLDVVSRWGYQEHNLFSPFGLSMAQLAEPDRRLSVDTANELIRLAHVLTGESTLAYHLGTQMRISIHGMMGYAIMTTGTVGNALALAERFVRMRLPFVQLEHGILGDIATVQIQCDLPLQPLRNEIMLALVIGIQHMAKALTGTDIPMSINLDFARPPGFERYESLLNAQMTFDQPHLMMSVACDVMQLPMVHADPISSQVAINQCEAELTALGYSGKRQRISMQVRDLLNRHVQSDGQHRGQEPAVHQASHMLGIEAVAERLHMSDRTLKRQLSREGTSFSMIVEDIRYRRATALLSRTDFTLEQIAEQLGYSDVTNFSRAFRRWSGRSPGQWRKDQMF